jgi:DNA-binding NarL/FixJ family response regulator
MKTVRIVLADDHKVVRQATRALLFPISEWKIVGEADNGREAVALSTQLKPDVAILDLAMPELNGLEATRQIKNNSPETEVLIFTGQETEQLVHDVLASGARSYIKKTDAPDHLIHAVKALSEHKHFFTSRISQSVFARYIREKEVLKGPPENGRS